MKFSVMRLRSGGRFLRELAIIVLGVFIALVLEQVAIDWRDGRRMNDVRASMDEEIADFAEIAALRLRVAPCIDGKLDALEALLAQPDIAGPWRNVGRPPFFFSSRGAWNGEASDLISARLGPVLFADYGEIYQGMEQFSVLALAEQDYWIALQTLAQAGEPLSDERRWDLMEATMGARNATLLLEGIAEQMTERARSVGVERNGDLDELDTAAAPLCQPLTAVDRGA